MTAALSPVASALLAALQTVNAMGEGSLKSWGIKRRPQLTLTQVEVRARELVEAGLAIATVRPDGRAVYRARERATEPAPVEVVTTCAECTRLAEALLSWERLWGPGGSDLAAMEARIQTAERERDEARAAERALQRQNVASYVYAEDLQARLTDALKLYESMCAELAEVLGESADIPGTFLVARARERLATQTTPPEPPPALSPNATSALAVLSTTRGTSPGEIATRSRILRRAVPHALAELRAAGVAVETTPGLWRRR